MTPTSASSQAVHGRKGGWRARVVRVLVWLVAVLFVTTAGGATYQAVATAADARSNPPPGQLVEIGTDGRSLRLHIQCAGTGSPTVILEGGQGGLSSDWAWIQPEVARTTRVCAYDRAGVGWSEPGPTPRDAEQIAQDLRALLERAAIPGPYVLVGHSYGGLYVRRFAATYPADVAGLVLVDASHPDQWNRSPEGRAQFTRTEQSYAVFRLLARIGLIRLVNYNAVNPALPAEAGALHKAMADTTQYVDTAADEFAATLATNDQVRRGGSLGNKPLFVLSATEGAPPELQEVDAALRAELVALSSISVHRAVDGADHSSLVIKEQDAGATTAAINAVITAVRSGRPLVVGP